MVVFPNAKINLGLRVTGKRPDGYHNLDTVFYPISMYDILELVSLGNNAVEPFTLTVSGKTITGNLNSNLCYKAYQLLKELHPSIPSVSVHLHKHIPMGAGLGGGSSDGAFMLKLLNEKFNLNIDDETLAQYALSLGSDCPFFIYNKPCHATSRGEVMQPLSIDLSNYKIVLISPGIHVSTAEAFSNIHIEENLISCAEVLQTPISNWKDVLKNDFEATVFLQHPLLAEIKASLYASGAMYASLTGTGSTVYGIFEKDKQINLSSSISHFDCYFL